MPLNEKALSTGMPNKKQALIGLPPAPLKKKRGRKPLSASPPSPPSGLLSFFKILIGDFKDVLFIPPLAACILKCLDKKYVYLEDADGNYWNVEMTMVDGSLAFQKGWHDFISDHSITAGEFVTLTYTGGLLFTVRIFGVCALERFNFQMIKQKVTWANEKCSTVQKLAIAQTPRKRKTSKAPEVKIGLLNSEVQESLKKKTKAVKLSSSKVHATKSDSFSEMILDFANVGEKHVYALNAKESKNALSVSEQINCINKDAKIEKLSPISPKVCSKSSKRMKSMSRSVIEAANLHCNEPLPSKSAADVLKSVPKTSTQAHDNKEKRVEMRITNTGKVELDHLHDIKMTDSKLYDDKVDSSSNLESAKFSPVMEFDPIELNKIANIIFVTVDGKCYSSLDENLIDIARQEEPICHNGHASFELESIVPSESISVVFSNPIVDIAIDKKETLMSANEEYGTHQENENSTVAESGIESCAKVHEIKHENSPEMVNGNDQHSSIVHVSLFDKDRKNVTPCSRRSRAKVYATNSADTPSSSCVGFSICLSDDAQSFLELPKKLNCPMGKLSCKRKVVVLQDSSMRCWPVLYHQSVNFIGFIGGWEDFARSNDICRGDVCEFELVDKMELKFQVHVNKADIA